MRNLITRKLSLNLNFEKREVKLEFPEPSIYNLLEFYSLIEDEKFISAIKLIVPDMKEKDFLSNPSGIVKAISKLIHGDQKKITEENTQDEGFLPATIDLMCNRYGSLPDDLMKKTTFTQLMLFAKGYEWNMNVQNDNEKANVQILMETDDKSAENIKKDVDQAKKDKELMKKMGGMPKIAKN